MSQLKFSIIVQDRSDDYHVVADHQYATFTDAVNKLDSLRATFALGLARGTHHAMLIINCDAPAPGDRCANNESPCERRRQSSDNCCEHYPASEFYNDYD